ncbi:hypothetical protein EIN_359760 [Entamoeba invadens IP1]|uniref:SKICH domain-containing protein n=1 Tax=Entamoeba invadens IP1 TaxID=370355 RepID=A0A0A1U7M9_ENTIV|nr:hypothetical protein EIN_359760 [Entamoeba invadens IP1]ELP90883.1 hypothetical protein EIN_359760 [Entamoeba invadens IP1]|eukprot:XP_004257654.1 hypothetical protein EIN_359760 [Entamoeba invadens IP1]
MSNEVPHVVAGSYKKDYCAFCDVFIPPSLVGPFWVGIYVIDREFDNKYSSYQVCTPTSKRISFDPLPAGMYEVRLFKDRYTRLAVSNVIYLGGKAKISFAKDLEFPHLIIVYYQEISTSEDWIGLFEKGVHSMKQFIARQTVSVTQRNVKFNCRLLKVDPTRYVGDKCILREFEFRYFKEHSVVSSTTAPSGYSKSFTLDFPSLHAERLTVDAIHVIWKNTHHNIWIGVYKDKNATSYMTYEYANQDCDFINFKVKYVEGETWEFRMFSTQSKEMLWKCELTKTLFN